MAIFGIRSRVWSLLGLAGVAAFACSEHRTYGDAVAGSGGDGASSTAGSSGRAGSSNGQSGSASGESGSPNGEGGSPNGEGGRSGNEGGSPEAGAPALDACEPNPCEHGTCEADGAAYTCSCAAGFDGDNCEIDIDDCEVDPCTHGTCVDGVDTFQCDCGDSGYTGNLCETLIRNCKQTPCLNDGVCTDVGASRTCNCTGTGFTGTNCEVDIDECDAEPCDPLTSCTNKPGGFTCGNCPSGYKGSGLAGCDDINECATDNGGCDQLTTCTNTPGSRACGPCPNGYSGTGAKGCTNIDDCAGSPCKNGGVCKDGINAYTCTCSGPWSGSTCQNATLTIDASARGFYADVDWFPPGNGNTITGWGGSWMYASYFVFPIPSFTGKVSAVTLWLEHEVYDSPDASEIVTVREVTTPVATLLGTTTPSQAIYQDLATGTQYGTLNGWSAATVGMIRSFALSGAITPVSAARGASFAIGVNTSPVKVASTAEYIRFSFSDEARTHQLQVVVVPQ